MASLKTIGYRLVPAAVSVLFFASLFFPMWQIELQAPQYPEGLVLKLYANKIGGDVEIINGLNHYIGMKTLHTVNFPEFSVLPYLIGLFGIAALAISFVNSKKAPRVLLAAFIMFAVLAASDFYRWNYNYGHDLDPNAAIKVPGMAYQPPLLGYKQLLNFGAYSVPDTGGWLLITGGMLLFALVMAQSKYAQKIRRARAGMAAIALVFGLVGCSGGGPSPIKANTDSCDYCKMTIANIHFSAEAVTAKGRTYKFDDVACLVNYLGEHKEVSYSNLYVADFVTGNLMPAETAFYLKGGNIISPMHGNTAAFADEKAQSQQRSATGAAPVTWAQLIASK